jgi:hypothetical protein
MRQQLKNCPLLLGSSARRARLGQHWQTRDAATVPSPHPPAFRRAALALAAVLRRTERTPQPRARRVPVAACHESRRHAKKKKKITGRIASYRPEHESWTCTTSWGREFYSSSCHVVHEKQKEFTRALVGRVVERERLVRRGIWGQNGLLLRCYTPWLALHVRHPIEQPERAGVRGSDCVNESVIA